MIDVLVVDDSDIIRTMILKTLRLARLPIGAVHEASNGKEALEVMEDNWVDLVFADINMPVMSGLQMVESMRRSKELANIPVIVVSTDGSASQMEGLHQQGIAAYVRKPFTPEAIRDVVTDVTTEWTRSEHTGVLNSAFCDALERFAFMCGEPAEKTELLRPNEDCLVARMTFSGAVEGAMVVASPASLCSEMAENILGDEISPDELKVAEADTLGELLNIACGHVASSLDPAYTTHLSPPMVSILPPGDWDRMIDASHARGFLVEARPTLVSLSVRAIR